MQQINKKSRIIETYCLLIIDLLSIVLAQIVAALLRFKSIDVLLMGKDSQLHYSFFVYMMLFCVLYSVLVDWNRHFFSRGKYVEAVATFKYMLAMTVVTGFILYITKDAEKLSRLFFGYFAVANLLFTWALHLLFKHFMMKYYKKGNSSEKVMVITEKNFAESLMAKVKKDKAWNYEITSIAVIDEDMVGKEIEGIPIVANIIDLFDIARIAILDEVFLFLPNTPINEVKKMILDFENMGITCHYSVDTLELDMKGKTVGNFAGYAVITFSLRYMDYRRLLVKRIMDILGGIIGLSITALLTPFVAVAIKIESRGPVFFSQIRIGKNGRRFKIYKFRSMYNDAEIRKKELIDKNEMKGLMFKMDKDPRITKVGAVLRKTSIDELPQFWNVLIGDMSLVGTRPPTEDEFEQYKIEYRRRIGITPGITGMWQVKGRGKVFDFDEVVKLDLEYIDNWSLSLDIKILLQTIIVVIFGIGAK